MQLFRLPPFAVLLAAGCLATAAAYGEAERFLDGNPEDTGGLAGPVLNLGGGGPDVDEAIQWMINQVRGCEDCDARLDVVVLRSSGGPGYNEPVLEMAGVDSVETIVIRSRQEAEEPSVVDAVRRAEVVFFAGGDQCQYVRNFKNTALHEAVKSVYRRGGGIGGTSAGAMIQGELVYNACSDTVETEEALEDPYEDILFTTDLFGWRYLEDTLVDTHFRERERMGRTITFVARQLRDGAAPRVMGIAVDEATSLVIDRDGLARVMGDGSVYLILGEVQPEHCEPQEPLSFDSVKVWRLEAGEVVSLAAGPGDDYYRVHIRDGQIMEDPY